MFGNSLGILTARLSLALPLLLAARPPGPPAMELLESVNRQHLRASWRLTIRVSQKGTAETPVDQILEVRWATFQDRTATLAFLLEPSGLRGVSVLTREFADDASDQTWVILAPKTKRPFVVDEEWRGEGLLGSDFSHEDNQRLLSPKDFHLKRVGKAACGSETCFLLQGVPVKARGYYKVVWWIQRVRKEIVRADFYAEDGKRLKTFAVRKWVTIRGVSIPRLQSMRNYSTGSQTTMELLSYRRIAKFIEEDFTPLRLTAMALEIHRTPIGKGSLLRSD
jgi:hypothetical protein